MESPDNIRLHIFNSDMEEKPSICFDTGLDPRSFARTKMSQSLIEPGYIVYPDGSYKIWKAAGVNEINGNMRVWGAAFTGKRLDLLINKANSEERQAHALQAVIFWIRAKMLLGDVNSTFNPGAAFICTEEEENNYPKGSVFFAPEYLSNRCLLMEGTEIDRFNCPDLSGMEAAAFCAGTMLYKILSKSFPFSNDKTIFQDMREGSFFPLHLAIPGLNKKICSLVQSAFLLPVESELSENGLDIISCILNCLTENENHIVSVPSLFDKLSTEEFSKLEKEKRYFLLKLNTFVKTKFFIINNKRAVIGAAVGLLFLIIIIGNTLKSFSSRPTTVGMDSDTVITAYFDAFSLLDHVFMEACIKGADKTDINTATTLYAINKTREVYERSNDALLVPAKAWKEAGGELPSPNVFGVTDLSIRYLSGNYEDNIMIYSAEYLLWHPDASYAFIRTDIITLKRDKKDNWRITEILRDEK